MSFNHTPIGIVAENGDKYVLLPTDNAPAAFRLEAFYTSNTRLPAELAARGITVSTKKDLEQLIESVGSIGHFDTAKVAEHPGWCGTCFVQHDGTVVGPEREKVHVVFRPNPALVESRGSLEGWVEQVVRPINGHPVPSLAVMAAFLPALLRFMPEVPNLALEFVGDADTGKSMIQKLAASVAFSPERINSFRQVQRELEELREAGRDYPMIIDHAEPALLTATKPKKAELYAAAAYDLSRAPGGRFTLLSGRQPLRDACGITSATESVLTLRLPGDGQGVFAHLPEGFADCAAFADSLVAATAAHHGHAYPKLLRALTEDPAPGITEIKRLVSEAQARFREIAEKAGFDDMPPRVMRAVSAIYAAGILAKWADLLPKSFSCRKAALAGLNMHQSTQAARPPFLQRLEQLIASGQLLTIDERSDRAMQAFLAETVLGTLTIKPDRRIIKIAREKIMAAFSDWARINRSDEVRALLKVDGKNLAAWGRLAPGTERIRLYQFVLPPAAPEHTMFDNVPAADGA